MQQNQRRAWRHRQPAPLQWAEPLLALAGSRFKLHGELHGRGTLHPFPLLHRRASAAACGLLYATSRSPHDAMLELALATIMRTRGRRSRSLRLAADTCGQPQSPQKTSGVVQAAANARIGTRGSCGRGAGSRNPPRLHPYPQATPCAHRSSPSPRSAGRRSGKALAWPA